METVNSSTAAERRMRAYLQCLGVVAGESALSRLSQQLLATRDQRPDSDDYDAVCMVDVLRRKEAWFAFLNKCFPQASPLQTDPFVGWRMKRILTQHPEALLQEPNTRIISDDGGLWDRKAIPRVRKRDMPVQPLGDMPAGLQKKSWASAASRVHHGWRSLFTHLHRE